jgi:APA family basic amino acid/polyamine antiporter
MVIANMVGTGVFTSLCFQTFDLTTGFSILFLWLLGGVIAFCGSVAYSELATIFPRNGGEYNLLSHIYHPSVGFLAGWVSVTVGFAAPVALAAMALGEYLKAVVPQVEPLRVSIAVVILVSIIHSVSVKFGSLFQNFFTIFKIILIFILIIGGVLF